MFWNKNRRKQTVSLASFACQIMTGAIVAAFYLMGARHLNNIFFINFKLVKKFNFFEYI